MTQQSKKPDTTASILQPAYVPILEAMRRVGGKKKLITALQHETLRARGRYVVEDERPREPDWLTPGAWYEGTFDPKTGKLTISEDNAVYLNLVIATKGLKKSQKIKSKSSGGRPIEHGWDWIERRIRELAKAGKPFPSENSVFDSVRKEYNNHPKHTREIPANDQLRKRFTPLVRSLGLVRRG